MKKPVIAALVVVIIAAVAGGIVLATKDSGKDSSMDSMKTSTSSTSTKDTSTSTTATQKPDAAQSCAGNTDACDNAYHTSIKPMQFEGNITIKKGMAVTWTNSDIIAHTVTESDSQTGPNSGNLDAGKSYSFTYNTVGTFKYHCEYHSSMTGTVTVTE